MNIFRDRITQAVLELKEKGELAKLELKWFYENGECELDRKASREVNLMVCKLFINEINFSVTRIVSTMYHVCLIEVMLQ